MKKVLDLLELAKVRGGQSTTGTTVDSESGKVANDGSATDTVDGEPSRIT